MSRILTVTLAVVLFAPGLSLVEAQEGDFSVRVKPTDGQCRTDAFVVGYIGYKDLECNCVFSVSRDGHRRYHFRAEPVIGGIESGSPAEGKLRPGDVVAAVDGSLITTREGGRRFSELTPGEPVTLTVRRRGADIDVTLVPEHACLEIGAVPPPRAPAPVERISATPRPPRVPAPNVAVATPEPPTSPLATRAPPRRPTLVEAVPLRPTAPVPPPLPDASMGWVGFSIRCDECRYGEDDGVPVWEFSSPPEVDRVESQSPAHEAGLRSGDRLTHINGQLLTRSEGGRLFGAVEPGDTVVFRYTRNNSIADAEIVAEERVALTYRFRESRPLTSPAVTRFSGVIGDSHVLVSGGPVNVNRTDDEIVIQAGDITVRVRRTGGTEGGSSH